MAVAAAVCAGSVAVLAVVYANSSTPGQLDVPVAQWLRAHLAASPGTWHYLSALGGPRPVLVALSIVVAVGYLGGGWPVTLLAVAGPAAAMVGAQLLKPLVGRTLGDYWALPSGHTTAIASLLTVAVVLCSWPGRRAFRVLAALMTAGLALALPAMVTALVRQGLHYVTDVIAGACMGFAVVVAVALILDRLASPGGLLRRTAR